MPDRRQCLNIILVCFVCLISSFGWADSSGNTAASVKILDHFWQGAKTNIYPEERACQFFTPANYQMLREKTEAASDIYGLTPVFNDFLDKLGVSHTRFFDNHSIDFHINPAKKQATNIQ